MLILIFLLIKDLIHKQLEVIINHHLMIFNYKKNKNLILILINFNKINHHLILNLV